MYKYNADFPKPHGTRVLCNELCLLKRDDKNDFYARYKSRLPN